MRKLLILIIIILLIGCFGYKQHALKVENKNLVINTEQLKENVEKIPEKTKESYDKLNEAGFFTKLGDWFDSFVSSTIQLVKDFKESI